MAFTVDIRGNATHLEKTLRSVKGSIASLGSAAAGGVAGLAALGAAGAAGLTAFVVSSSQAAASIEDLALQFEVLTGSAETSKDLLKAFKEEEKKSALSTQDYANAAKTFLAFGGSVEDALPSLKMLADVSMGNSDRFASLALAFSQTTAAGRLMGQEVLQFVNAGFNPLEQIARTTGKSMAELKKEMEDGKISVSMVKDAFIAATSEGGRFYKAIDRGSATTSAKINQTKAAVTQLQVAFGTGFNEGLKDALDATNNFLPQLEGKFAEIGQVFGGAISMAIEGNTEQLARIGAVAAEMFFEGFKAFYLKAFDELIAATQNKFSAGISDPAGVGQMNERMNQAFGFSKGVPIKAQAAPLSQYMQEAMATVSEGENMKGIQAVSYYERMNKQLAEDMKESTKSGVKEGMKEVWYSLETGAKFSN